MFAELFEGGEVFGIPECSINLLCDVSSENCFKELGLSVILNLNPDVSNPNFTQAHAAKLNIVQNTTYYKDMANYLKNTYNIPYIIMENSNCGIEDLTIILNKVSDYFDIKVDRKLKVNRIIQREVDSLFMLLNRYRSVLKKKRIVIYGTEKEVLNKLIYSLKLIDMDIVGSVNDADIVLGHKNFENECDLVFDNAIITKGYMSILLLYKSLYELLLKSHIHVV